MMIVSVFKVTILIALFNQMMWPLVGNFKLTFIDRVACQIHNWTLNYNDTSFYEKIPMLIAKVIVLWYQCPGLINIKN